MRSESDQMIVGKEKSVDLQSRDLPGEQENALGNAKQKEEKKEVFTKVRVRDLVPGLRCLRCAQQTWWRAEGGWSVSAPRTATGESRRVNG